MPFEPVTNFLLAQIFFLGPAKVWPSLQALLKTKMMQHITLEILLLAMTWDRHKYEVSLNGFLTFYVKHFIDLD
jgi:hypothetical protein